MGVIKVVSDRPLFDGMAITVKAPCHCTSVDSLSVSYLDTSMNFSFRDAHGRDLADINNLFLQGAYIRVILDTKNGYAYIQNADTNSYLESALAGKAPDGLIKFHMGSSPGGIDEKLTELVDGMADYTVNFYSVNIGPNARPVVMTTGTYVMRVYRYNEYSAHVTAWNTSDNAVLYKKMGTEIVDGVTTRSWTEWEWENPPLMDSSIFKEEYRTAKRHNGEVVYEKLGADGVLYWRTESESEWHTYANLVGAAPTALGAPHNYLDNSDFRNPVNQRGKTSYNSGGYCIDRWYSAAWNAAYPTVAVESGGIHLTGGATGANTCSFEQAIEAKGLCGKTLTVAVKYNSFTQSNQSVATLFAFCDGARVAVAKVATSSKNLLLKTFTVPENTERITIYIGNSANDGGSGTYDAVLEWAALYEGEYTVETLPDYKPKGYGVELMECHRYFRIVCNGENDTGVMTNPIGRIETHFQMRAKPAMLVVGSPYRVYTNATGQTYRDSATIVADNISTSVTQRIYVENCDATWMSVEVDFIAQGKHAGIFWSADL